MTTQTVTTAEDTWVNEDHPARHPGSAYYVRVGGTTRAALVLPSIRSILGRTVVTAPLSFHVGAGHVGQTYTVKLVTEDWSEDSARWNNKPSVGSTAVTATVSAQADGSVVTIDLATLMQRVADGQTWYGVQITSDAASEQLIYANDSGQPAWEFTVELSDDPEQPEGLFPDVGAVGAAKVVLGWRSPDLDGASDQADYKVQFSTTDNWAAPDSDTGWLAGTLPRHDMTAYSYALTAGANTGWRVQVRDSEGRESAWSDPAHVTYDNALGTLVLDSPASTTFGDPTLRVQAHMVGEDITKFRIRVAKQNDRTDVVYNSRVQPGDGSGLLDFELPFRSPKTGKRVLPDDLPRWLNVRAWGDKKRGVGEGRADYVETWVLITADDDIGVTAPSGLTVTPVGEGDPRYVWSWSLGSAPDAVLIMAGDEVLARLTADNYTEASGTYTWADDGVLSPWQANACQVRAVVDGARSGPSNVVSVTPRVSDFWVIEPTVGAVKLKGLGVDQIASTDAGTSVAAFLDGREYAVTYGPARISGTFLGTVTDLGDLANLEALRALPTAQPRVIWGTRSLRVRLHDLSPMPHVTFSEHRTGHAVSIGFTEVED